MECKVCNTKINTNYREPYPELLTSNKLCYDCYFWHDKITQYNKGGSSFIVDSKYNMYFLGDEDEVSDFRGHGGRRYQIELTNGESITSTNLWCNGEIPDKFCEMLEPNVTRIRG